MLIEHALAIFERKLVPLRGIWIDPVGKEHEATVTYLGRCGDGYEVALDGMWGGSIIPIPAVSHFEDADRLDGQRFDDGTIQFGALRVEVDHFRQDPLEWLIDAGVNVEQLNQTAIKRFQEASA